MAAIPIAEQNYRRRAHRVTFPLSVEINGKTYRARDWSLIGVGLEGFDVELETDQTIPARCIVPVPGCFFAIAVTLQLKSRRTDVCGFEFHNLKASGRRVLRQYMESAIEGNSNAEDLLSAAAMPGIATPIEEALNLTELEAEGLLRKFKAIMIEIALVYPHREALRRS